MYLINAREPPYCIVKRFLNLTSFYKNVQYIDYFANSHRLNMDYTDTFFKTIKQKQQNLRLKE